MSYDDNSSSDRSTRLGIDRRQFLKTLSASAVATGFVSGGASARSSFREAIQTALQIKEETNSLQRYEQFLEGRGFTKAKENYNFDVPHDADGPSTQKISESSLDITLYLWHNCSGPGYYYADLNWTYDWSGLKAGAVPKDIAGLGYNSQWWDLPTYDVSTDTNTSNNVAAHDDYFGLSGVGFKVDDYNASWNNDTSLHWGGVYLNAVGSYDSDDRRIQGGYAHLWNQVEINTVNFGYPGGVSVGLKNETYGWETRTEDDGNTLLRVRQSDSAYCA